MVDALIVLIEFLMQFIVMMMLMFNCKNASLLKCRFKNASDSLQKRCKIIEKER